MIIKEFVYSPDFVTTQHFASCHALITINSYATNNVVRTRLGRRYTVLYAERTEPPFLLSLV